MTRAADSYFARKRPKAKSRKRPKEIAQIYGKLSKARQAKIERRGKPGKAKALANADESAATEFPKANAWKTRFDLSTLTKAERFVKAAERNYAKLPKTAPKITEKKDRRKIPSGADPFAAKLIV